MNFLSDNTSGACPEMLAAIAAANAGAAQPYGDDAWTARLTETFSALFGKPLRVFPVISGTAANSLALATLVPPYGAIFAHEEAHIVRDECGAPEFMSGGARVVVVPGAHAKVSAAAISTALDANPVSVHSLQPACVSITQATERGATYRPDEIAALAAAAHARGMKLHMDGARLANAIAFLGCHPADVTWRAGVDVLSFGATKNGALSAEAVVFFDPAVARDFELRRKRAGHLLSKMRYVSAQLLAYVRDGLWLHNAQRANALALRIGAAARASLANPVEANEVFLSLGVDAIARLRAKGFEFYDWGASADGLARFVVSWNQPEAEVEALCRALDELPQGAR